MNNSINFPRLASILIDNNRCESSTTLANTLTITVHGIIEPNLLRARYLVSFLRIFQPVWNSLKSTSHVRVVGSLKRIIFLPCNLGPIRTETVITRFYRLFSNLLNLGNKGCYFNANEWPISIMKLAPRSSCSGIFSFMNFLEVA